MMVIANLNRFSSPHNACLFHRVPSIYLVERMEPVCVPAGLKKSIVILLARQYSMRLDDKVTPLELMVICDRDPKGF